MENFPSNRTFAKAPSDEGAGFLRSKKTGGENVPLMFSLPPSLPVGKDTSLIRGRLRAIRESPANLPPRGKVDSKNVQERTFFEDG